MSNLLIVISLKHPAFSFSVFHGFGGQLPVSDVYQSTVGKIMNMAFDELGVKKKDINGRSQYGKNVFKQCLTLPE